MSERQCREALLRLSAGRRGSDVGASSKASRTFCHSDTGGSGGSSSGRHTGGARVGNTGASRRFRRCSGHFHCVTGRGKTGCPRRLDAACGGGKARFRQTGSVARGGGPCSKERGETSCQRASPCSAPPDVIVVAPRQVFVLVRTKCRAEYRAYCSDVDIGGGRVVACLQSKAASLSPTCQSDLAELGR
jgi:hypothetical protein